MSRETNMTVGRPTKLILGLAVPLILTNVGQQLYTVADASIVGRGVGVEALAALGATDWLYWLVLWTVQAMTQGFSVLVSQTFGSNDKKGLRKAITMSVLLCAAVGILLTVVFVSSAGWLLHLLDTPENIYDGAHIYLTMMYAGTLITMAYNMAAGMILFGRHVVALFISADAANAAEALSVAYDYLVVMSTFLLSAYVLHTSRSALQGMGFTTAPRLSGLTEFAGRVGASLLLTRVIGERGLFYTDAAAWTFAAVFLAASYYIQLFIIRKKGLTYQNTK